VEKKKHLKKLNPKGVGMAAPFFMAILRKINKKAG